MPMNLPLAPEQEDFVQQELAIGNYTSATDLLADALQLLAKRRHYDQWARDVQEKVAIAAAQLERGEGVDGETAVAALRARLHQRHQG